MQDSFIDLSRFKLNPASRERSAFAVQLWWLVQFFLIHPSPQFMYGWRRFLWRLFGARVGKNVIIRPSARVTYPWKVEIGDHSWIGDHVELYSLAPITIGKNCVISQQSYLCAGTHDYTRLDFPLVAKPVIVEDEVWVASGCFVAPGVTLHKGCILGARSVALEDVARATIAAGHPAKPVKNRPVSLYQ